MKICYVTDLFPPYDIGGAEKVVETETISMIKKGNEVTLLTTDFEIDSKYTNTFHDEGLEVIPFHCKSNQVNNINEK